MGIHTWHRWVESMPGLSRDGHWEYADTEGLTPPEGEGWTLCSAFGVSGVPGAGGSPARPAKKRPAKA